MRSRSFLAPEFLQVSSIDCGVASVACLLAGYGIEVGYERLREMCRTSVDGTSINSLEELCEELGVVLCQHIVPKDQAIDAMEGRFPLIAVVSRSTMPTHFVTVWRRVGDHLQIMDPQGGRRWVRRAAFAEQLFTHQHTMDATEWSEWMTGSSFRETLQGRARALLSRSAAEAIESELSAWPDPKRIAALEAALRLVGETNRAAGRKDARWNDELFGRTVAAAEHELAGRQRLLPPKLWSIVPYDSAVTTEGAVMLAPPERAASPSSASRLPTGVRSTEKVASADASTVSAKSERHVLAQIWGFFERGEKHLAASLIVGTTLLTLASAVELIICRAAINAPFLFKSAGDRAGACAVVAFLALVILGLEAATAFGAAGLARCLEVRLRMATLYALPRVGDKFIRTRPASDLAYRAHSLVTTRNLPFSLLAAARGAGDVVVTLAAIAWVDPRYVAPVAVGAVLLALTFHLARARLRELDSRNTIHASRLLTLFLDALRGLRPIRLHGYQDAFRAEQRRELELWSTTNTALAQALAGLAALEEAFSVAILVAVFCIHIVNGGEPRKFVLLVFWAFRIPVAVRSLLVFAQRYPLERLSLSRLLEITRYAAGNPTAAPVLAVPSAATTVQEHGGVAIAVRDVAVVENGVSILDGISLEVSAGQKVGIVGPTGSGKSTFVRLLLGVVTPTTGELSIDGRSWSGELLDSLRRQTAWVDPSVQLWNSTVRNNVEYSANGLEPRSLLDVVTASDLLDVIDNLDRGLETCVGPDGTLVSGGEGQRIRVARSLRRRAVRLAILDEAFRGLERDCRRRMQERVMRELGDATVFMVTHDISHVLEMERVIVLENGRIVEDGRPSVLAASAGSRFRALLEAERRTLGSVWGDPSWRRIRIENGGIVDDPATAA